MSNEKIIGMLNGLLEISRDGAEGFRTCANDANDPSLKMYFEDRALSCDEAIQSLSEEILRYGGEPETRGTRAAAVHRTWIDIKTALTNVDNLTVLEECERGEDVAVIAYEKALQEEMPDSLREVVNQQYEGAKRNHERVRELRDEARENPDLV